MKRTFLVMLAFTLAVGAKAQEFKIGYTNFQAIVLSMPEIEGIESEMETYQGQLNGQINTKIQELQGKIAAFQQMAQDPNAAQIVLKERQNEIEKLQKDLQAFEVQAEQAFATKRGALLEPVGLKVRAAVDEVRKELGYALILDAGNIISGDEALNVTEAVFAKLGVPMPTFDQEEGASAQGNGNN